MRYLHKLNKIGMSTKLKVFWLKVVIHCGALIPLVTVYYQAINDRLGADPVQAVINFTGIGGFNLLLLTLLVAPIARYTKQGYVLQTRRLLGLYAFTYASFHLINFIAFDLQFRWLLIVSEIIKRPYITIGLLAFILLLLLAVTSIAPIKRNMGRRWQTLHNSIYLIVVLVAIHFYWSVKLNEFTPLFYLFMTTVLLTARYYKLKRWFKHKLR